MFFFLKHLIFLFFSQKSEHIAYTYVVRPSKQERADEVRKNKRKKQADLSDESASLYGPRSVYIIIPGTGYTYLYKEGFTYNDDVSSVVSLWLIATLWAIS